MSILREDPYSGLNFQVVVTGTLDDGRSITGSFAEVSGLDVEVEPIEYRTGSEGHHRSKGARPEEALQHRAQAWGDLPAVRVIGVTALGFQEVG
jgi:hypothetical protein